jgi:hypothetical protein
MLGDFPGIPNSFAWFGYIAGLISLLIALVQSWRPVVTWLASWNRKWALRRARSIARRLAHVHCIYRDPAAVAASAVGVLMAYIVAVIMAVAATAIVVILMVILHIGGKWSFLVLLVTSAVACIPMARSQVRMNELLEMRNMGEFRRRSLRQIGSLLTRAKVEAPTREFFLMNAVENARLGYALRDPFLRPDLQMVETGEPFKEFIEGGAPYR